MRVHAEETQNQHMALVLRLSTEVEGHFQLFSVVLQGPLTPAHVV